MSPWGNGWEWAPGPWPWDFPGRGSFLMPFSPSPSTSYLNSRPGFLGPGPMPWPWALRIGGMAEGRLMRRGSFMLPATGVSDQRGHPQQAQCQIYAQTFATDLSLDLYRILTSAQKARLLRGEVDSWETSPLNNSPLLTGLEKRYSPKCCFPIRISQLLLPKWCFTTSPEVAPRCHRPQNWGTPGGPKIHQKTV